MIVRSKAQQGWLFSQRPDLAAKAKRTMKRKHLGWKSLPEKKHPQVNPERHPLPEKTAADIPTPANYWTSKAKVRRLEGGTSPKGQRDVPLPKQGFGTMYGTGQPKLAFELAFADEICKIAAGPTRTKAIELANKAAPVVAKKIKGIRRKFKTLPQAGR